MRPGGRSWCRDREPALRPRVSESAGGRSNSGSRRAGLAGDLRRGRDRQATPGRRLALPPGADVVAIGGQLRAGDATDVHLVVRPDRRTDDARNGGYFTARHVMVLKPCLTE